MSEKTARKAPSGLDAVLIRTGRSMEQWPSSDPDNPAPIHSYLLVKSGVPIIEVLQLEELARDNVYEFAFISMPLKIRGATGAPLRPIALPIR